MRAWLVLVCMALAALPLAHAQQADEAANATPQESSLHPDSTSEPVTYGSFLTFGLLVLGIVIVAGVYLAGRREGPLH